LTGYHHTSPSFHHLLAAPEPEYHFEDAQAHSTEQGTDSTDEEDSGSEAEQLEKQEHPVLADKTNQNTRLDEGSVISKSSKMAKTRSMGGGRTAPASKAKGSRKSGGGSRSKGVATKSKGGDPKSGTQRTNKHKAALPTNQKNDSKRSATDVYSASDASDDDDRSTLSSGGGDAFDFKKQYELERKKNEQIKLRERNLQDTILSASRSKKGKLKTFHSAMEALVGDSTKNDFFKIAKFIANDKQLENATAMVLDYLDLEDFEDLHGAELDRAKKVWVESNKEIVRITMNEWRNYIQGELFKLFKLLNSRAGGLNEVPNADQILNIAKRSGMKKGADANYDATMKLLVGYWDLMIPKVAGHKDWGPGKRHHLLMSFAHRNNDARESLHVTPSDEAFLVVLWENCYNRWIFEDEKSKWTDEQKAADAKAAAAAKAKDEDYVPDPRAVPPYTNPKGGVSKYGGWNKAGRKRYREVLDIIIESKKKSYLEAIEKEALALVRAKHNCDEKEAKRKKAKVVEKDEIDSDHEPDWMV
jgi:hypothetical protein